MWREEGRKKNSVNRDTDTRDGVHKIVWSLSRMGESLKFFFSFLTFFFFRL